jgi:hypothetical protein
MTVVRAVEMTGPQPRGRLDVFHHICAPLARGGKEPRVAAAPTQGFRLILRLENAVSAMHKRVAHRQPRNIRSYPDADSRPYFYRQFLPWTNIEYDDSCHHQLAHLCFGSRPVGHFGCSSRHARAGRSASNAALPCLPQWMQARAKATFRRRSRRTARRACSTRVTSQYSRVTAW